MDIEMEQPVTLDPVPLQVEGTYVSKDGDPIDVSEWSVAKVHAFLRSGQITEKKRKR